MSNFYFFKTRKKSTNDGKTYRMRTSIGTNILSVLQQAGFVDCGGDAINSVDSEVIITTRAFLDIEGYDLRGIHKSRLEEELEAPILFV